MLREAYCMPFNLKALPGQCCVSPTLMILFLHTYANSPVAG